MIFYFSGTGNSRWAARQLATRLGDETRDMAARPPLLPYKPAAAETIVFVFPVHSWGLPLPVRNFMKNLVTDGTSGCPVFVVCTCGDDCGRTDRLAGRLLRKKGWEPKAVFSVQMPNNYILLPGFDVDSDELAASKLRQAAMSILEIGDMIAGLKPLRRMYTAGRLAGLKTELVYPLFVRWTSRKPDFYATGACISCGICVRNCPTGTIVLRDKMPIWGDACVQCLACIHRCPVRAIEYGKATWKKGRYCHPSLKGKE